MLRSAILLFALSLYAQESYDLVIANGSVIDGSGAEARRADVGQFRNEQNFYSKRVFMIMIRYEATPEIPREIDVVWRRGLGD